MRKKFWYIISSLLIVSVTIISWSGKTETSVNTIVKSATTGGALTSREIFAQYTNDVYQTAQLQQNGLDYAVFQKAVTGYYNLKLANKLTANNAVITVVDFSKSSSVKRMWIIDLNSKSLLLNTWVAHGQGSGNDMATAFSNTADSHQSSLGFYITDDIYYGKHGRSLKLDGMDAGFNNHARSRAIVLHAADYVSQATINQLGRLGRSHGCPAVSNEVVDQVINTVKGKTLLFINANDSQYTSRYLNEDAAAEFVSANVNAPANANAVI
jgi:hypothetical protein